MTVDEHLHQLIRRYPSLEVCKPDILAAYHSLEFCFAHGRKVLLCGNGGSAADCDHIVGELVKAFRRQRPIAKWLEQTLLEQPHGHSIASQLQGALPAITLTSQNALISAIANDVSSDMVFAQQVYAYGRSGDLLIGISTSGNSQNVVYAMVTARAMGLKTIGLIGKQGGRLKSIADVPVCVPAETTVEIQELHLPIYHMLCAAMEDHFFPQIPVDTN